MKSKERGEKREEQSRASSLPGTARKTRNIPGHFLNRFDRFGSLVRAEYLLGIS
jgi:hypothetical protein